MLICRVVCRNLENKELDKITFNNMTYEMIDNTTEEKLIKLNDKNCYIITFTLVFVVS